MKNDFALYINGVFESVLTEILGAQEEHPGITCYLQPHGSSPIKRLVEAQPTRETPITLYLSTSTRLDLVTYQATIIGWEDKQKMPDERRALLDQHIKRHQPGEEEIYLTSNKGQDCVNLIHVQNLQKLHAPFSVSNLIKLSDDSPYKPRTQAGGYSYVYELPTWIGKGESVIEEQLQSDLEQEVAESEAQSQETRLKRLAAAPRLPEKVQVLSVGFRRNPDVIVEVLNRANGKCERCHNDAPFLRAKDRSPYLEIHHWKPLSEGGEDTVENAGALCPNCHREVHYG